MKIYFDDLGYSSPNLYNLSENGPMKNWLVASGTNLKNKLTEFGIGFSSIDQLDDPGCYFIDVNGDPSWWNGVLTEESVPKKNVLLEIPENIINLVKDKKIRIIIAADREGGEMINSFFDCFASITDAMQIRNLPQGSVLVIQGNQKIEQQYNEWLVKTGRNKLFDVMYSNHFNNIFYNPELPNDPIIIETLKNNNVHSFNSLNRVHRTHRAAHLCSLVLNNVLEQGLVSGNQVNLLDHIAAEYAGVSLEQYAEIMEKHFPKFIDGDWSSTNAANQYNIDLYKNTYISVITETKFNEDVIFPTEKIFKPLALGHPVILFASAGTLALLKDMGFRVDWCGIDPSYNDIIDHKERFVATTNILLNWINLSTDEKIKRITDSMPTIRHNFKLMKQRDFYRESIQEALNRSQEYFK